MRDISTGDIETDPFERWHMPVPFAAGYYTGKSYQQFTGENCIRSLVLATIEDGKKRNGIISYYHNGGKFDLHFMLQYILEIYSHEDLELLCIGARLVSIKTPFVEFRDSFALIPKPLRSFGGKLEIDIKKLHRDVRTEHMTEILTYLKQDCVGLYNGLLEFSELYGNEITLASTTFKVLAKKFDIKPVKTSEKYDDKFRPFYFAGRVQFFALGLQGAIDGVPRFKICDINSAFPAAMICPHWFGAEYETSDEAPTENPEHSFYNIVCDSKGALPFRKRDGGVDFPHVIQAHFFVSGWEYITALELGLILNVKINFVYTPLKTQNFAAYVNFFYEQKKNAKTQAERDFAKLFLNALYGKFATDKRDFRDVKITPCGEIPPPREIKRANNTIKKIAWEKSFDDKQRGLSFWQSPSRDIESGKPLSFYNVNTAASVTGFVRAFLQRSMTKCGGVLYTDTDSLILTNCDALEMSEDKLGAWKLEKVCDAVWIGGKKLYVAHASDDKGVTEKPATFFREVNLPSYNFRRWYVTDKDFKASWKTASKGVRLPVEDLIAVCDGEERTQEFDAPNLSVYSKPIFASRTIRRDDKRKKKT